VLQHLRVFEGPPELALLLNEVFAVDVASVEGAQCEWAPDKTLHLNDRTAFDAFVIYRDPAGRRCFLAVETKYTEPFSQKEYDSQLYRDVTARSGFFRDGAGEQLIGRSTNQLWRMAMLAASLLHAGTSISDRSRCWHLPMIATPALP